MKYILLVHHSKDTFEGPKDPADVAAGRAYGEALRAAGIFVADAGLVSPQNATSVSVREGKRQVQDGPYGTCVTQRLLASAAIVDAKVLEETGERGMRGDDDTDGGGGGEGGRGSGGW